MSRFSDKRVVVAGLDQSGQAACRLLSSSGASVFGVSLEDYLPSRAERADLKEIGVELVSPETLPGEFDFVVFSSSINRATAEKQLRVKPGIPILSDLEVAHEEFCCLSVAVAGTNGKTTTAGLIEKIFERAGRKSLKAGGSGMPICDVASQTQKLDFLTLEVNSFQLEGIETFRPAVAILLNLKPDHMDRYDHMSHYAGTMARVFSNQQVFDWAIVQSEALAHLRSLDIQIPSKIITFSAHNRRADIHLDRGLILSTIEGWAGPLFDMDKAQLQGPHNAENIMAALAAGHVLRIAHEEMAPAVKDYFPEPHRLEFVAEINGVRFINNSKAMNADAVSQSIQALPRSQSGEPNLWLIAGGKDKGLEYHDLGPLLAQRVRGAFLIGQTREKLRAAWSLFTPCALADSLLEAVSKAAVNAAPGDYVLLSPACSSFDMFQNYQSRGEMFREAVAHLARTSVSTIPGLDMARDPEKQIEIEKTIRI